MFPAKVQGGVVACQFPEMADFPIGEPNQRMEEKQNLDDDLQPVDPVVEALEMSELMEQNRFKFAGGTLFQK